PTPPPSNRPATTVSTTPSSTRNRTSHARKIVALEITTNEQSHWCAGPPEYAAVQSPLRWYGVPSWPRAHMIAVAAAGGVSGGSEKPEGRDTGPPAPPPAHRTGIAPEGSAMPVMAATSWVASGSHFAYA